MLHSDHNSSAPAYEAALVQTPEERTEVLAIRMNVFVDEQNVPPEEEMDALDDTATHFLVRHKWPDGGLPEGIIGTARLIDKGNGVGKVGRVAILREFRGKGAGTHLMQCIEETAKAQGYHELILEAQLHAIAFYEKLGYVAEGEVFLDANIEHRLMRKSLQ